MRPVPTPPRPSARAAALAAVTLLAAALVPACQGAPNTVTLAPPETDIYGTTAATVVGTVTDANGRPVATTVAYTSSKPTVASVPGPAIPQSPNGDYPVTVTGLAVVQDDSATITGTEAAGRGTGTMKVRVHPAVGTGSTTSGATVTVSPSVRPGFTYEYRIQATAEMRVVNVTFPGRGVASLSVVRHAGGANRLDPTIIGSGATWVISAGTGTITPTDGYTELVVRAVVERAPATPPTSTIQPIFFDGLRTSVTIIGPEG